MSVKYSRYIPAISLSGDFLILNLLCIGGFCYLSHGINCLATGYWPFYLYLNIVWAVLVWVFKATQIDRNTRLKALFFAYIKIVVFFFFLFLIYFQVHSLNYLSRDHIKYLFPLLFVSLVAWKFLLYYAFFFYRKWGYNYRNVIIIGHSERGIQLKNYFEGSPWNGYRFLGFFDEKENSSKKIIGTFAGIDIFLKENQVHEVYLLWDKIPVNQKHDIVSVINNHPVRIRIVPELDEFANLKVELVNYDLTPVIQIHRGPLRNWYNRLVKRIVDIIISVLVITGILSWFTVLVYLFSIGQKGGSIFFVQKRTGTDGKVFNCVKYRTMKPNREADNQQATLNDDRVTRSGRFLRKTSLDELPQFFNVLMGQMSVVGPRPHMLRHTDDYRKQVQRFMTRHTVKPGITGLAQVRGYRGEIKTVEDLQNRVNLDVFYVEKWNLFLDIRIMALTIWIIFKGQPQAY